MTTRVREKKAKWQEVEAKLKEIRKYMLYTGGFDYTVKVVHQDGTLLVYESAFAREWFGYYLIFTEHNGYHWFHKDEVTVNQYTETDVPALTDEEQKLWKKDMKLYQTDPEAWHKKHTYSLSDDL